MRPQAGGGAAERGRAVRRAALAVAAVAIAAAAVALVIMPQRPAAAPPSYFDATQAAPGPVRLVIPALGVDAAIVTIATDAAGVLVPASSTAVVGWFAAGPAPGATGPALLAGHVDSRAGPGVFFRLRDLHDGDRVDVVRADATASFTVTGQVESAKSAFPTGLVYAPTPGPELRLVTCGGAFDHAARSYLDNMIVQALPTSGGAWTLG